MYPAPVEEALAKAIDKVHCAIKVPVSIEYLDFMFENVLMILVIGIIQSVRNTFGED